jgi:D-citramalate synthase
VNGLGERCGNCSIAEIALALQYRCGIPTIDLTQIQALSRLVAGLSNVYPAQNTPVVGANAFRHDAGIHHAGLDRNMAMYEPYSPELVGTRHTLSLGKLSGTRSIMAKLKEFELDLPDEKIPVLLEAVKSMNEAGEPVSDADFRILAGKITGTNLHDRVTLEEINVMTGNKTTPAAMVHLKFDGEPELRFGAATGSGPVDAAIKAMNNALGEHCAKLIFYNVDSITGGSDAQVRLNVTVELNGKRLDSSAIGTDIFMTSVNAYLKAVNVLL